MVGSCRAKQRGVWGVPSRYRGRNFVKRGVPAVVIEFGTDLVDPSRPNKYPRKDWYHKPSDEYREDWDFSGTLAHVHLMYAVGLSVANATL